MIERLLGETSRSEFLEDYLCARPFSAPGTAFFLQDLGTWERVEAILDCPEADALVCRQGQRWEQQRKPTSEEAHPLFEDGYTLLVRHAERHDPALKQLADEFHRDFNAPVNVHVYCTPTGEFGFGWHYDAEEVFILQSRGEKEYSLRKNTVNPWPTVETLPPDMQFERELMPVMKCLLKGGDWLYIPNGYWHVGEAKTGAISLAVGVMLPTGMHVLDCLRRRLRNSLMWRQRLPVLGDARTESDDESRERYRELFSQLGDDLQRTLNDPGFLEAFLAEHGNIGSPPQ